MSSRPDSTASPVPGQRVALHQQRRTAARARHRRRGPRRRRQAALLHAARTLGSMAEQTVIDMRRSVVLPAAADPIAVAAAMNPAMSSWMALRRRIGDVRGTGCWCWGRPATPGSWPSRWRRSSGRSRIVAAGRDARAPGELPALGANDTVSLEGDGDQLGDELAAAGPTSTSSSTTCGVSRRRTRCRPGHRPRRPRSSPDLDSDRLRRRGHAGRSHRPHCARRGPRSSAAARAPSPPTTSWPNCRRSPGRSPPEVHHRRPGHTTVRHRASLGGRLTAGCRIVITP